MSRFKLSRLNNQFTRFLISGGVNTGATYVLYVLLSLVMPYTVAYTIAYIAGIGLSYLLASYFVFKQEIRLQKALVYPVVYLVQYLAGVVLLTLLVEIAHINRLLAVPIVIVLTLPLTFVLSKLVLTRKVRSQT